MNVLNPLQSKAGAAEAEHAKTADSANSVPATGVLGILPIANGGTGTNTAEQALSNLNGYPKTGGTITGSITTTITSDENNIKVTHTNGTLGIFGNTLSGNRGMWDSDPTRSQKYVIQHSNSTKNYTFHGNADTATSAETANSAPASGINFRFYMVVLALVRPQEP